MRMMQYNNSSYNRRDHLDDHVQPCAGYSEPLLQSTRAYTEEQAQAPLLRPHSRHVLKSRLHTHVSIQ